MNANKDPLRIRKFQTVDSIFIDQFNRLLDEGDVWDVEEGIRFLSNRDNALFVAFWNDEMVGFLSAHRLQRFDRRKAEVLLYEIAVLEKFRKRGIGRALIQSVKSWAHEVGADEVWVLTNISNDAAMALYKSEGGDEDLLGKTMFTYTVERS